MIRIRMSHICSNRLIRHHGSIGILANQIALFSFMFWWATSASRGSLPKWRQRRVWVPCSEDPKRRIAESHQKKSQAQNQCSGPGTFLSRTYLELKSGPLGVMSRLLAMSSETIIRTMWKLMLVISATSWKWITVVKYYTSTKRIVRHFITIGLAPNRVCCTQFRWNLGQRCTLSLRPGGENLCH